MLVCLPILLAQYIVFSFYNFCWLLYTFVQSCVYIVYSGSPLYYFTLTALLCLQCGFLIWCMMPVANNGSMFIYQRIIRPFVATHEKTLDAAFDSATQLAKDAGKSGE